MRHHEFGRDLGAFALAVHVHAAGIDRIGLLRPVDQLLQWLVILRSEFPPLRRSRQQNVMLDDSLPPQGLAHRKHIVSVGRIVLLEAQDQADLTRRFWDARTSDAIWDFDHILDNRFSRFVLQFVVLRSAERRDETTCHGGQARKPVERSVEGYLFHKRFRSGIAFSLMIALRTNHAPMHGLRTWVSAATAGGNCPSYNETRRARPRYGVQVDHACAIRR